MEQMKQKHGGAIRGSMEPEYKLWASLKARCYRHTCTAYRNYGAKGIGMCNQWRYSYDRFRAWARRHGFADGLQIDRIRNNRGYSPSNCRFVTPKQNCWNRERAVKFPKFQSCSDVAKKLGVTRNTIRYRVRVMGLSLEQAATMPKVPNGIERKRFWTRTGKWREE